MFGVWLNWVFSESVGRGSLTEKFSNSVLPPTMWKSEGLIFVDIVKVCVILAHLVEACIILFAVAVHLVEACTILVHLVDEVKVQVLCRP